ncbi:MAG: hypothetical protein WD906_00885 [Anaerolineales bacterium]
MSRESEPRVRRSFPRWLGVPILVLLLPIVVLVLGLNLLIGLVLHGAVWMAWLPPGESVLIVSSESPICKEYMADRVMAALRDRSVVLNWSGRSNWPRWPTLEILVFWYFGWGREFNPLAIVFRPLRIARVFRFWKPFREFKHGRPGSEELTRRLLGYARV